MFRLSRLVTRNLNRSFLKPTLQPTFPRLQPFSTHRILFQDPKQPIDLKTNDPKQTTDPELEQIDPKDYPELYPDETIDTEWFVDEQAEFNETDFIPLWQRQAVGDHLQDRLGLNQTSQALIESGQLTASSIESLLKESKLEDVKVLDVRLKCDWTDYMIVASSTKGDKYLTGVAEHVSSVVKKVMAAHPGSATVAPYVEGKTDKSGWILIDLGKIVVHLFTPDTREKFDLEGLWESVSTDPSEPMKIQD